MEIPISAEVSCTDGVCGEVTCVIVEPVSQQITHVVVEESRGDYAEHLVPIALITAATPYQIRLRCSQAELAKLPQFVVHQFKRVPMLLMDNPSEHFMVWPYALPDSAGLVLVPIRRERVPAHELALHRDSWVMATDGHAGEVDELVVDPTDEHITQMILRRGHFWRHTDVSIPVTQIDRIEADTIYVKLDKYAIGQLPPLTSRR